MQKGFTLIELVVGIGIFSMVALMGSLMMISTIRASKKAAAVALVRNEGTNALNVMTAFIRYADTVSSCSSSSVSVVTNAQDTVTFDCGSGTAIASNSANLTSSNVVVSGCSFSCDVAAPATKSVGISFVVNKVGTALPIEAAAGSTFNTTVGLRNK